MSELGCDLKLIVSIDWPDDLRFPRLCRPSREGTQRALPHAAGSLPFRPRLRWKPSGGVSSSLLCKATLSRAIAEIVRKVVVLLVLVLTQLRTLEFQRGR